MKCPKCQFENPDDAQFCIECGNTIEFHCPNCDAITPATGKFCKACGHDLRKPTEIPLIDYSQPQSYTPKLLKDKILTNRSSIEGERKLVTVFFADVANYTAMSEKLDPEEIHQIMDGCFKIIMDEIHKYEGTINQFTGDGVMALFGAPVAHEDHAQRACRASLSVQKAMADYGEKIKQNTGFDFKMRIGLNSGHVIVGSIGDDLRMDYTAVGDTTNLASRMEGAAEPGTVLISENTYKLAQRYFVFEPEDKIEVKGKVEPQKVYELIKTSDVETRIEASMAKGLTRFVGRKSSLPALMEVWDKAKSGSGQVVGVVGEAGVGKSRILLELRNRLLHGEFTYLEGRCLHYGENIIYMPILDIIKSYFDIKDGDREFTIKKKIFEKTFEISEEFSESSLPVFQEFLFSKVDDEEYLKLEPQQRREKTFETIRDLFIRESQKRPLILAIEDLHWIDKTSEDFLNYMIEWLANTPIMLILLYRTEYRHQWGSKTYYNRIGLSHLGTESSTELVKAILEGGEVAPELRGLIMNRAAGNPLFIEEFTHTLIENGSIKKKDKQYVLSRSVSDIHVPDTIQGIIAARMDRLEDNLKRTMQVASVIGRDFAFRILLTITGMREELKSYLLNLQGLEFIYEKRLLPELEYIFKHALTQEVAYNSLLLKRKREIHEKIGKAIEEIYAKRLEEFYEMLAYHFDQGELWDKAFVYAVKAGMKARHGYIFQTAMDHFDRAKDILEKREPDVPWRVCYDLYFERGAAWVDSGQARYSFRELEEAANIARINERTDLRVKAMVSHAIAALYSQERDELKSILEEMEPLVTDDMESLLGVIAVQAFSCVTLAEDLSLGLTKEKEMTDLFHRAPNSPFSPHAGYWMGFFHRWRGEYQKCSGIIEPLLPEFKVLVSNAPHFYLGATCWYALALGEQGLYQDTIRILEEGREFGIKSGERYTTPKLTNSLGWAYNQLCHFDKAIEYNNLSLKSIQDLLGPGTSNLFEIESQARINLGEDYLMTGDRKKAQEHLELVYENMRNPEYNFGRTRWKPRCLLRLGELWLQAGDTDKAESFLSELIEHQWTDQFPYMKYKVLAYRLRGQILATRGQIEEAEVELHRVLTLAQKLGNPTELWKTHQALGAMLLSQSKGEEARAEFHAALEVVQGIAEGLTDAALKEGYLQSHPIKELASQAERSQRCKDRMA